MAHNTHEPPAVSTGQYYSIVRGQIEHEDNLVTQRLNWFLTSQSFLFTAYAITLNGTGPGALPGAEAQRMNLLRLIPLLGFSAALLILITVVAGILAMHNLRHLYRDHVKHSEAAGLPPVQGCRPTQFMGLAAPVWLPALFLLVWVALLVKVH